MATLFIADPHLCTEEPAVIAGSLRFLVGDARKADALYILGGLLEAQIGDDDPNPLHHEMAAAIESLADSGVPCFSIHGNRDFLLGKRFTRASGMISLPEERVFDLYGRKVLIICDDTSYIDDADYQTSHAKVHQPWSQKLFPTLPLFTRQRITVKICTNSKATNHTRSPEIMGMNQQAVISEVEKHQVQWLIHGHTRRSAVHELTANEQSVFRVVLDAWHTESSMIKVTPDDVELIVFPSQFCRYPIPLYTKLFKLHRGSRFVSPLEFTKVGDWGEQMQPAKRQPEE